MLNKVQLIGNLGADTELKYMPSGDAVATMNIATTNRYKDKQTGEKKEHTEWHRVVFFNKLAEIAGEYLKKGSSVYIEGRLQTRKWQGQDGKDNYTTEIIASEMKMLGGKRDGDAGSYQGGNNKPSASAGKAAQKPQQQIPDDFDDDIQF